METEITPLTDDEARDLAVGILGGAVFTDRHLRDGDDRMIASVFMVLGLADKEVMDQMLEVVAPQEGPEKGHVGMIYEWMDQAGPLSINGYPMFFSVKFLGPADTRRVSEMMQRIQSLSA